MKKIFDKLVNRKDWADPIKNTSPKKFTKHRQRQLADIFELYNGNKIPFSHFTKEIIEDPQKRNRLAFPVVFAYICGILRIEGEGLVKPKDLVLGKRDFLRSEVHWV